MPEYRTQLRISGSQTSQTRSPKVIAGRVGAVLLDAEVSFGGLNRRMPERNVDLLEIAFLAASGTDAEDVGSTMSLS